MKLSLYSMIQKFTKSVSLVFLILIIFSERLFAARKTVDSLLNQSKIESNLARKAELLNRVAFMYRDIQLDSALIYSGQATDLAKKSGNDTVWARSYVIRGIIQDELGDLDEALVCADSAIYVTERLKFPDMMMAAYSTKAKIKRFQNEFATALTYYFKALEQAELSKDPNLIAKCYTNLGIFYVTKKDLKLAEENHLKALEIRQKLPPSLELANVYENLGILNRDQEKYAEALNYYFKSLDIYKEKDDSSSIAFSYNDIGAAYSFMGNVEKAEKYLLESIAIRKRINEVSELAYTLNYLGENYERKGNFKLAEFYLKEALKTATENNFLKQRRESLESISNFYERNKMYDSAFYYSKMHRLFKDSLLQQDNEETIAKLTTKFQTAKKEKIIEQQKTDLNRRKYLIWALSLFSLLILVLAWTFYQRYKLNQQKKLQETIMEQQDMATKAVLEAEENERHRIAADLHDGIGQLLTAARLNMEALSEKLVISNENERIIYDKALSLVDESCKEVRNVSHNIMPNSLIKFGLGNAIKDFIEKIESKQLSINLNIVGLNTPLDSKIELILYRVLQEAINNVIKHAKANQLDICIERDEDGLRITIEDNGIGFNKADMVKANGIGMKNIIARIEFLKGELDIDTKPGRGTLLAIFIPQS